MSLAKFPDRNKKSHMCLRGVDRENCTSYVLLITDLFIRADCHS